MSDEIDNSEWTNFERPGYFGKRRDEKIAGYNSRFGEGNWRLRWVVKFYSQGQGNTVYSNHDFVAACKRWYEASYIAYFAQNPKELDYVCSFSECIDNDMSNLQSGLDYTKQESWATHIQDIAVRNALARLGRKFEGKDNILVIRSKSDNGYKYGPGNIPFIKPELIEQPSKRPHWANDGTVEDFWQSNKWVQIKKGVVSL